MASIETKRHSLAHVLAMAVLDLCPDTKMGIGPIIENGFYYDFDFRKKITSDDLEEIQERMGEFIKSEFKFEHEEIPPEKARENIRKPALQTGDCRRIGK